jgi:hypothetical protein
LREDVVREALRDETAVRFLRYAKYDFRVFHARHFASAHKG